MSSIQFLTFVGAYAHLTSYEQGLRRGIKKLSRRGDIANTFRPYRIGDIFAEVIAVIKAESCSTEISYANNRATAD